MVQHVFVVRVDLQTLEVFSYGDRIRLALWGSRGERSTPKLGVHVGILRRTVEPNPSAPALIRTVRGFGYRVELPN